MKKPKKISPEAIAAFRRAISEAGTDADEVALHAALGLRPWHATVFDVDRDERPDWIPADEWRVATALRQRLLAAIEAAKAVQP
jgi:hypothetical protein